MTDIWSQAIENFLSPPILFFVLGVFAAFVKSDLEIPKVLSKSLSIYLMIAIGIKGGFFLLGTTPSIRLFTGGLLSVGLSFGLPFLAYFLLRRLLKMDRINSIAVAAHYGSTSIVTFITATHYLEAKGITYAPYFIVFLTFMESPAIISAMYLKSRLMKKQNARGLNWHHILFGSANILLFGSMFIALLSGSEAKASLEPLFIEPFTALLSLFLLDMGISAGKELREFQVSWKVYSFGIFMPILSAFLAAILSAMLGFDQGGIFLFCVLSASASYIVVPAAMQLSLPEANPGLYLPLSLGVTFPFNIILGLPLYFYFSALF